MQFFGLNPMHLYNEEQINNRLDQIDRLSYLFRLIYSFYIQWAFLNGIVDFLIALIYNPLTMKLQIETSEGELEDFQYQRVLWADFL